MSTHYTANPRRVYWGPFFLDFFLPLLWLVAILNLNWDGKLIPFWLGLGGLSFIFYRVLRRIAKRADTMQLIALSGAGVLLSMSLQLRGVGDDLNRAVANLGAILFVLIAVIRGHALRLERLEGPTSTDRSAEFPGIYCITCAPSGKQYIGQTSQPIRSRWKEHLTLLNSGRHHNRWLQADWNLYRPEQFTFSVLEIVTNPVWLLDRERYWQDKDYDPAKRYNPPNIPVSPARRRVAVRRKSR